eukprot:CAMPEP_0119038126 /NCGR_PEP_ID=MMETSP1177-20130426/6843_1 /TAXON_ID=2985 /ORGANISM="Ochromonas sp, Strain CCMP1899" /LENGTH=256 /DNA_ID=CAMNT_0007000277 /DNA_START=180 /DNA_END=950 /DNA_ORIENTATION=-
MAENKQPSTKERLAAIVNGFDDFDSEMKIGTRQRREQDEFKIADLKNTMTRLDTDLVVEIKRRTEMNKSTQMWFEQNLAAVDKQFHTTLDERKETTMGRLDGLSERITTLDEKRIQDKEDILLQIETTGKELKQMLAEFKTDFDNDKERRGVREDEMVRQLTEHEHEVGHSLEDQIHSRESRYEEVRNILERNIKLRDKAEERFQAFFEREIYQLHNSVKIEKEVREHEDDEIVEALNRYTIKLQNSLQIINSTEM